MKIDKGFTLLESIVAMVLLSMIGLTVLSWVGQSSKSVSVLLEKRKQREMKNNILALASVINPANQPRSNAQLGGYTFSWIARPSIYSDGLLDRTALINQNLNLYRTQFSVSFNESEVVSEFNVEKVGYRRLQVVQ